MVMCTIRNLIYLAQFINLIIIQSNLSNRQNKQDADIPTKKIKMVLLSQFKVHFLKVYEAEIFQMPRNLVT